jgi:hypothetical protein
MLKIKIPFGFKMIQFDNLLTIYTGKIRIKASNDYLRLMLFDHLQHLTFTEGKNYCTTISFCTTDYKLNLTLIDAINDTLATIMHDRINIKYRKRNHFEMTTGDLPF